MRQSHSFAKLVSAVVCAAAMIIVTASTASAGDWFGRGDDLAATPTARYTARFDATWTAATHPINYPVGAHWSSLVGGSHDSSVQFWQEGQLASLGIKDMAERGLTAPLVAEVQAQISAGHAGAAVVGGSIATGAGVATATFDLTQQFSRATLVTMVAPSPDWFVGVAGLALFVDGHWLEQVRVPLYCYDAGTDSGTNYNSPNQVTMPAQPIALNPAAPFANGAVLGYMTFTRTDGPISIAVPATGITGLVLLGLALFAAAAWTLQRKRAVIR